METVILNGKHYEIISEDEFRHHLLSTGTTTKEQFLQFLFEHNPKKPHERLIDIAERIFPTDMEDIW